MTRAVSPLPFAQGGRLACLTSGFSWNPLCRSGHIRRALVAQSIEVRTVRVCNNCEDLTLVGSQCALRSIATDFHAEGSLHPDHLDSEAKANLKQVTVAQRMIIAIIPLYRDPGPEVKWSRPRLARSGQACSAWFAVGQAFLQLLWPVWIRPANGGS
jgi:hypothetical protein